MSLVRLVVNLAWALSWIRVLYIDTLVSVGAFPQCLAGDLWPLRSHHSALGDFIFQRCELAIDRGRFVLQSCDSAVATGILVHRLCGSLERFEPLLERPDLLVA